MELGAFRQKMNKIVQKIPSFVSCDNKNPRSSTSYVVVLSELDATHKKYNKSLIEVNFAFRSVLGTHFIKY